MAKKKPEPRAEAAQTPPNEREASSKPRTKPPRKQPEKLRARG